MFVNNRSKFKIFRTSLPVTGIPPPFLQIRRPGSYRLFTPPPIFERGWSRESLNFNVGKFNSIHNYKNKD